MVTQEGPFRKLLILNPLAGSLTPELDQKLRAAFSGFQVLELAPGQSLSDAYASCPTAEDALVVVVGGDGSVEGVVPCLAGSRQTLGIVPLGTFNNFARALDLPLEPEAAVKVVLQGRRAAVTLGRAQGTPFLETAAVGLFGDALALGEAAKDREFTAMRDRLRRVVTAAHFRYRLSGDVQTRGRAYSILFANTPSVGARLEIADTTPAEPYLELQLRPAETRLELLARMARSMVRRSAPREATHSVRSVTVETWPPVPYYTDSREAGMTPVTIEAQPGGLWMMLPNA